MIQYPIRPTATTITTPIAAVTTGNAGVVEGVVVWLTMTSTVVKAVPPAEETITQ